MAETAERALDLEAEAAARGLPSPVYLFASFAYAYSPETDSGVLVSNLMPADPDAVALAAELAQGVVDGTRARRPAFRPDLPTAEAFLSTRPWRDGRRRAILELSDNHVRRGSRQGRGS